MIADSEVINNGDKRNRESIMNKLHEDNEPVLTDGSHPEGRIGRLKDEESCEDNEDEDADDLKSLTLDSLKDKSRPLYESQRDRDFVSESSLTIVGDSDLFQENSRWWSMINNSDSNSNINNPNHNSSTNVVSTNLNSSLNNNTNTPANNSSNNASNNFYNATSPSQNDRYADRRRSSLLSDITFESDEHPGEDIDAHTTDSNDSSWANPSRLHPTTKRFSSNPPNYNGRNNRTTEEELREHHKQQQKQNHNNYSEPSAIANTAAPVIPRRRVSAVPGMADSSPGNSDVADAKINNYSTAKLRAMANRGNAAAPTIPKRTSSHSSKVPPLNNNAMIYQMYNASYSSVVDSQLSYDTELSFAEEGSAAAAAAAAYLSNAGIGSLASQQEEVRTVHTAKTSHTTATPVLTNLGDGSRLSREEAPINGQNPPVIPERRGSGKDDIACYSNLSSFDDEDESPPGVHEEPPIIPLRKGSDSSNQYSISSRSTSRNPGYHQQLSRLDNQPPTCPMRKGSNHHIRRTPKNAARKSHHRGKVAPKDSPHMMQAQDRQKDQPSCMYKPPMKPMRTGSRIGSSSVNQSPGGSSSITRSPKGSSSIMHSPTGSHTSRSATGSSCRSPTASSSITRSPKGSSSVTRSPRSPTSTTYS